MTFVGRVDWTNGCNERQTAALSAIRMNEEVWERWERNVWVLFVCILLFLNNLGEVSFLGRDAVVVRGRYRGMGR